VLNAGRGGDIALISMEPVLATRATAPTMAVSLDQDQTPQASGSSLPAPLGGLSSIAPRPAAVWLMLSAHNGRLYLQEIVDEFVYHLAKACPKVLEHGL
jgi:hypothetical protein